MILAMAFGSGAIGNGRSLRERKSLDKVELFFVSSIKSSLGGRGVQQRFAINGCVGAGLVGTNIPGFGREALRSTFKRSSICSCFDDQGLPKNQ